MSYQDAYSMTERHRASRLQLLTCIPPAPPRISEPGRIRNSFSMLFSRNVVPIDATWKRGGAVDKCVDRSCGVLFGRPFLRRILCCVEYHAGFHVVAENREEIYEFLIARRGEYRIVIRVFVHRPVACADPEGRVYHVSASVHSDRVVVGDGSVVVKVACCRLCVGDASCRTSRFRSLHRNKGHQARHPCPCLCCRKRSWSARTY